MSRKYGKKTEISLNPLDYSIYLMGEGGIGKEQPVSEPVLGENGWIKMGDIKPGMKVYGQDGKLWTVTDIYPQGVKPVYEVTFRDGTKTRCGKEHLWTVTTKKMRSMTCADGKKRARVVPLSEIMKDYKKFVIDTTESAGGHFDYKYAIPVNAPIEFEVGEELPIPPYALGLLLGDGGFTTNVVTFTNSEDELFSQLEKEMTDMKIEFHYREFENHKQAVLAKEESEEYRNPLIDALKKLNLWGCGSREKFIPKEYIYTSAENRFDLLSGIINTDGSAQNKALHIATYSKNLAYGIAEVARSLGFVAPVYEYDRTDKDSTQKYDKEIEYSVHIIGDDYSCLKLSEKHKSRLKDKNVSYVKSITNIRYVGEEECQCIMIDNPEHLYITNDYIVTHNTTVIKQMCEKLVGDDGYMFLTCGKEADQATIEGIVQEPVWDWEHFDDVTMDIIENRFTDYQDLKVVVIDTIDELMQMAEGETLRIWNKENPDKRTKTFKGTYGGFNGPTDKAIELVINRLWELKRVGISPIIIGHTKKTDITDPVTLASYSMLSTNMDKRYFNALKNKVDIVGVAYVDRDIDRVKTGRKNVVTHQDEIVGKVKAERRVICFRDDNFSVDSKSRFENIVDRIPLNADEFIKAIQDAIKAEHAKGGRSYDADVKKQAEEKKETETVQAERAKQYIAEAQAEEDEQYREKWVEGIQIGFQNATSAVKSQITAVAKEVGMKFSDPNFPIAELKKVYSLVA